MNNKAEISKKKTKKQGHLEAWKFKNKKNEVIMIYFWPLASKKVS